MSDFWWLLVSLVLIMCLGVVFFGAPYLPTRKKDLNKIFKLLALPKNSLIVDLGSGDGRVIITAARLGYRGLGLELNPLLVILSWFRLGTYRKIAKVELKNYWQSDLPADTAAVFVFLASAFMPRLKKYLEAHVNRTKKPLLLVSYGFDLPGYTPINKQGAILVYKLSPLQP